MSEEKYERVPKPEPTPIWDEWLRCPKCGSKSGVNVDFEEKTATAIGKVMGKATERKLTLHLSCHDEKGIGCEHTSEHRSSPIEFD